MPSDTSIVNAALKLIGGTRITALDDGSPNANHAVEIYDDLRDDLLRSHEWNFATSRAKLAKLVATPVYEFDNAFALPSDWLRTISVHDNDAGLGTLVYREELVNDQRVIVASREDLWMRYVARSTDPNLWPSDFVRALTLAMARDLAIPVASSNGLHDRFAGRADRQLARAKSADAMGSFPESRPAGSWAMSRGGRWPRNWAGW